METVQNHETANKSHKKDVKINPLLKGKYDNEPLFQLKADRANEILKLSGIPNFEKPE